ncbi:MAG: type VI secretion system baseplate subunit TssG, partial [Chitinispirillaceae bacterium]|nr:type VI secretion system baseplate subunit TssG [Chitinispirillaceae bacterium]
MSSLIEKLTKEFHNFNFFRAVYLLEQYIKSKKKISEPIEQGYIRFRPDKSIAFPPNDIAEISEKNDIFFFTLYFMGLVGTVSPLPVYFSEYIVRHPDNSAALYDFLTIFNHRIYTLFYRSWKKYNFIFNFSADGSDSFTQKIANLCGFTSENRKENLRLLAYCGILSAASRSSAGLKTIISNYFDGIPVKIVEFVPRWAELKNIKPLGSTPLGKEAFLGTSYYDRSGKFRIIVGPLPRATYE